MIPSHNQGDLKNQSNGLQRVYFVFELVLQILMILTEMSALLHLSKLTGPEPFKYSIFDIHHISSIGINRIGTLKPVQTPKLSKKVSCVYNMIHRL